MEKFKIVINKGLLTLSSSFSFYQKEKDEAEKEKLYNDDTDSKPSTLNNLSSCNLTRQLCCLKQRLLAFIVRLRVSKIQLSTYFLRM